MSFIGELFYITPLKNIRSIIQHGILSNKNAEKLEHVSIALQEVQFKRERKRIPQGNPLHDYVNLYFNPRNPMMYKRRNEASEICVLSIKPEVLSIKDAVVSDQNAAKLLARFYDPKTDLDKLDFDKIYIRDWNVPDYHEKSRLVGIICSEALIPGKLSFEYVQSAYVVDKIAEDKLRGLGFNKHIIVKPDIFFRG